MSEIEPRYIGGRIVELKEASRDGVQLGIFEGYLSTWEPDTGGIYGIPDKFHPGAWTASLAEHKARGSRQIRLKNHHGDLIGGFPIELAHEDAVGLAVTGEVNLNTQQGREGWALMKQEVLTDLSAGYTAIEDRIEDTLRHIYEAKLWEGSLVDEPANQGARILELKRVVPFQDLPLGDRDRTWDAAAAVKRVKALTGSEEAPSAGFRRAFVIFDAENADNFGAYKLPIADVVDGKLVAVPKGIFAAAGAVSGARSPMKVSDAERSGAIRHLERYYAKMDEESPFDRKERRFFGVEEARSLDARDLEAALHQTGSFSKGAARVLASRMGASTDLEKPCYDAATMTSILEDLKGARQALR
jgi:HK97 family phage prohead protease